MELYDSEEQQVEAIKSWWQENGKAVIIGTVVGLCAIGGWNYYQSTVKATQEAASVSYQSTMTTLSTRGLDAQTQVQSFIDGHSDSNYASLAALQLAKVQVEAGNLDEALAQLEWAKAHTNDEALTAVASYRVARIMAEQGDYDEALATLSSITSEDWKGRVLELKGDISLAKGDKDAAYIAYTEAQQANDAGQMLQLKLNDLAK